METIEQAANGQAVVVDILDAFAGAVRKPVTEVHVGDKVFDTFGGQHKVVRVLTSKRYTRIFRDDHRAPDVFLNNELITVLPKES